MKQLIKDKIRAGFAGLFIKTSEEARIERIFKEIADELVETNAAIDLYTYDVNRGFRNCLEPGGSIASDPVDALKKASELDGKATVLFFDIHVFLEEGGSHFALSVKHYIQRAKANGNHLVFVGCRTVIPPELESEVDVLELDLPDREILRAVVEQTASDAGVSSPEDMDSIVNALRGLTLEAASDVLSYSLVRNGGFVAKDIAFEKAKSINKSGLMEVIQPKGTMDDVGGLDEIKGWVRSNIRMFDPDIKLAGGRPRQGVLNVGVPGSGKSMFSEVLANTFGLPILRVDVGSLYGSLVGSSEENLRKVLSTAEAMAPVVLELDEIDKGIGSTMGAQSGDSGTTQRIISKFLNWAAQPHEGVFVVATANDPSKMMDSGGALIRRGRFDEIFFFDFPSDEEREAIARIHLNKVSQKNCPRSPLSSAGDVDLRQLVEASRGYTGAEIESAIIQTMNNAFNEYKESVTTEDFLEEFRRVKPISESQRGLDAIREWGNSFCRPASKRVVSYSDKLSRKIAC